MTKQFREAQIEMYLNWYPVILDRIEFYNISYQDNFDYYKKWFRYKKLKPKLINRAKRELSRPIKEG